LPLTGETMIAGCLDRVQAAQRGTVEVSPVQAARVSGTGQVKLSGTRTTVSTVAEL
jgi:hypothetical protein